MSPPSWGVQLPLEPVEIVIRTTQSQHVRHVQNCGACCAWLMVLLGFDEPLCRVHYAGFSISVRLPRALVSSKSALGSHQTAQLVRHWPVCEVWLSSFVSDRFPVILRAPMMGEVNPVDPGRSGLLRSFKVCLHGIYKYGKKHVQWRGMVRCPWNQGMDKKLYEAGVATPRTKCRNSLTFRVLFSEPMRS